MSVDVSIIIPIYNVAPYVEQCLKSVVAQTYNGEMECLLIDDCGTDDSIAICKRFIAQYEGPISFRILHHDHNRGLSAARNTGIEAATGEYLYFLDSDDWITPTCIEQIYKLAQKYLDVQLVQAGAHITEGTQWLSLEKTSYAEYTDDQYLIKTKLLGRYLLPETAWNKLVKRDFILTNRLYFEEGLILEDNLWMNMLAKHVNRLAVLRLDTYYYRIRENSITNDSSANIYLRRILVERVKISRIDDLYKKEQIEYILDYDTQMYYQCHDSSLRKEICCLHKLLAKKCHMRLKLFLYLRYLSSEFDSSDGAIGFRLYSFLVQYSSYFL